MHKLSQRFVGEQDGLEMVEWAIVAVLIAVAAGSVLQNIAPKVLQWLVSILVSLSL